VRTVINEVDLPGRDGVSRRQQVEEAMAIRAAERAARGDYGQLERAIRLGGGFTYWSNTPVDELRNTPSRPAYTNGLFLYPFSVSYKY
jgi:hypothetical protein